jgi:hypothetical protein
MALVIPDISPAELLTRFRGTVIDVHPAYPETIHLKVRDADGGEWRLCTADADYSPSDPDVLRGKVIVDTEHEGPEGDLTVRFSDGSSFEVTVEPQTREDDPFNWMLFTPEGLVLEWGPGESWRLVRSTDPL